MHVVLCFLHVRTCVTDAGVKKVESIWYFFGEDTLPDAGPKGTSLAADNAGKLPSNHNEVFLSTAKVGTKSFPSFCAPSFSVHCSPSFASDVIFPYLILLYVNPISWRSHSHSHSHTI